jgi:proline iminopeptidase
MGDGALLWTSSTGTSGKPGMVFVHGGPGMWDNLGPVATMAEPWFRTHRYDHRGCGRSSPDSDYRMSRFVTDLDELREHFGHERWYVFGHSFGALLGLHYAATHPDRVAGLIYCSGLGLGWPAHRASYHARADSRLTAEQIARREELSGKQRTGDEEVEWRTLCWLPDFADPADAAAEAGVALPLNPACNRILNAEAKAWSPADEHAVCARVVAPVWLLHGAEDPRPVDGVADLARTLRHATLSVLDGAGHQPWREKPDAVRAVLAHVADIAARG